ncbi:MAG: RidA family protein [archaeon]
MIKVAKKFLPFDGPFPLSKAVISNDQYTMEISGQIGINPNTKKLEEGIVKQTEQAMELIKEILAEVGWDFNNLVKTRIFLTEMSNYQQMNEVYSRYFSSTLPTRFTLAVKELPAGALVEIDCTATGNEIQKNG